MNHFEAAASRRFHIDRPLLRVFASWLLALLKEFSRVYRE